MKINKVELQQALEIVKPGLANKEIIEQSTSFAFIDGRVVTYNDEISISHPVEGLKDIRGAIHADELYKFINKLPMEDFEISLNEKFEIVMVSGRSRAGLTLQSEMKLPLEEISSKGKWKPVPEGFTEAIRFVMSSCSRDMSRPVLTCVHVSNIGIVEASDSYRITRYELGEIPFSFLLPATSAVDLVKINPTKMSKTKGWVHFQTKEGTEMSCRIYDEEFPDCTPFLKVEGVGVTLPRTINEVLDRASIFAKRDYSLDEEVEVTLGKKRMKISSRSDAGWFEEEININFTDSPISFSITPYLLKDILSKTLECTLCEDRLKFEGDGWIHITILKNQVK